MERIKNGLWKQDVRRLRERASVRRPTRREWRARVQGTKGASDLRATNRRCGPQSPTRGSASKKKPGTRAEKRQFLIFYLDRVGGV